MAQPPPTRIFISYARKDGADLAQRLQSDLTKQGLDAWLDTQRLRSGASWTNEIETALDRANYVLVLLTQGSYVSEICRSEQLRALRKGTCVIPIKAQSDTDIPLHLESKHYRDFSDPSRYDAQFKVLLRDMHDNVSATLPERYRHTPVRYLTAPPRVANYLERPEALRALRDAIFAEDQRQPIALTALAGMGGIGKTVLAKALTDDEVVQRAFPDGIVWITAGKERKRDFVEEMREVAKALGDDLSGYDSALACENRYRTTIAEKAALIVVDDVWSKSDIEPLLAESPRSRFLFTTRDVSISRFVGAHEHRANLLDQKESRELLAGWANAPEKELPTTANDIIVECGRLPLALSVVGAMLRDTDEQFWTDTLDLLRKADLSAIEDQLPEGQQSFFKAVEISFQSLKPELQERYKALAVLPEDMPVRVPILQTLWNTNEADARRISKLLVDRSLAQDDVDLSARENGIRLHDLQLDYIRAQFPDREALDLIHDTIRMSVHVIAADSSQFASQIIGRLLPYQNQRCIHHLTDRVRKGSPRPWLRPIWPAMLSPGSGLLRTLKGHTNLISRVVVTIDDQRAVSAWENELRVWDLNRGLELLAWNGLPPEDRVQDVAVTPDGRRVVFGSYDGKLKLWDPDHGLELLTLKGHAGPIWCVAVTPDGRRVVSGSGDKTLKVWDVDDGQELRSIDDFSGDVTAIAVDNCRVLSVSKGRLELWDLKSGRLMLTCENPSEAVNSVAMIRNHDRAISAHDDAMLKVWDLKSGRALLVLKDHTSDINSVKVTPDGRRAISAADDSTLKVWDLDGGRILSTLRGHTSVVYDVDVTPDGLRAVSVSYDGTVRVWRLNNSALEFTSETHGALVSGVAITPDGRRAVSLDKHGTLKVWDVRSGRVALRLEAPSFDAWGVAVTPDGSRAISASLNGPMTVWDLDAGERRTIKGFAGQPSLHRRREIFLDNYRAVFVSDRRVNVTDLESGRLLFTLGRSLMRVGVAADGRRFVSAQDDGTLKVWDLESRRNLSILRGHSAPVQFVAVTPDGRRAVSMSLDNALKVWDLESDCELLGFEVQAGETTDLCVTTDGRHAVSSSIDNTIRIWDLHNGRIVATFTCEGHAHCCAAGANVIVAGDNIGRIYFLEFVQ